jgi:hypothetical protein
MRLGRRKEEWARWFAWYPVNVGYQVVWLEVVERRRAKGWELCPLSAYSVECDVWEYR